MGGLADSSCPCSSAFRAGGGVDLLDLEYLDAAVGLLAELDRHVLRHEGAGDAHPLMLPLDQVALDVMHLEKSSPDLLVTPVAVDVHPERHAVELVAHECVLWAGVAASRLVGEEGGNVLHGEALVFLKGEM